MILGFNVSRCSIAPPAPLFCPPSPLHLCHPEKSQCRFSLRWIGIEIPIPKHKHIYIQIHNSCLCVRVCDLDTVCLPRLARQRSLEYCGKSSSNTWTSKNQVSFGKHRPCCCCCCCCCSARFRQQVFILSHNNGSRAYGAARWQRGQLADVKQNCML